MLIEKAVSYFVLSLESEQLSAHTIKAYLQDLNQFMNWTTKTDINELDFEDFQSYFMEISHLKINSIKRKRVVMHRFFKFCYRKKLCKDKLYEYIDPIRSKKHTIPKEVLKREEITRIFDALLEEQQQYKQKTGSAYYDYLYYCAIRNQLLVGILLYTGCRAHEVVALKKQDIDLLQNTITLFTKGGKYNQVPIHDDLRSMLDIYKEAIKDLSLDMQQLLQESTYLFPSKTDPNTYMPTRTLHDLMKKLSHTTGRHIHAHLFRHTFASYCIAANMDISTISSLISHSNPSITLSIYTHEIDSHNKQEQIKKLSFK